MIGSRPMTARGSNLDAVTRRSVKYIIALALLFSVPVATGVLWSALRTPRSNAVSTTVCYVALSNDLAPLFGSSVSTIAASPECAQQHDRGENLRDAAVMTS